MPSPRKVLHLISQAHLDPVWLWPLQDGVAETLTTCQSAVDRLQENPGLRFSRSSAAAYHWVKETDPRLFAAIQKLVAEGRWEVVGGWVEQPDCNLPSAESFLRQAIMAREFFAREFPTAPPTRIGYNVDSFGHCGGLPHLLQLAGLDAYAFMRPEPWDNPEVPLLFWWESPRGARVLSCRIPTGYSQSYSATPEDIERVIREAEEKNFAPGFDVGVMWFGVGNHGGGPTREHIARVLELQKDPSLPEIRFSTLADFLHEVRNAPAAASLPVWRGELGYVFRGCYAANGQTKRLHRASEKALFAAEASAVAASRRDLSALAPLWWELLNLQFHDILAGTCVAAAQEEIEHRFGSVLAPANQFTLRNALTIARQVDTARETSSVVFAYNPLPWRRQALIHLDTFQAIHGREEILALLTPEGHPVPIQWLPAEANFGPWGLRWGKLTALVDLPPSGYQVLSLQTRTVEITAPSPAEQDSTNPQFAGGVQSNVSALGKFSGPALSAFPSEQANWLQAPIGCVVIRDEGGTWGHGKKDYAEVLGCPEVLGHELLVDGPLVTVYREKSRWGSSEIWTDFIRTVGSSDLQIRLRFNWQEQRAQLKLQLPTCLEKTHTLAKMPAEIARRPTNGEEYPCHDWVVLEGTIAETPAALAVGNDATYSYAASEGCLRFTLARGVPHAEHPPFDYQDLSHVSLLDQGWQERRFLLRPLFGTWCPGEINRLAEELQIPPLALFDSAHPGELPYRRSGLEIQPASVAVLAIKPSTAGEEILVRLQETRGESTRATLRLGDSGASVEVLLKPWEICTLVLDPQGKTRPLSIFEEELPPR